MSAFLNDLARLRQPVAPDGGRAMVVVGDFIFSP
jgi:hypothetical protein